MYIQISYYIVIFGSLSSFVRVASQTVYINIQYVIKYNYKTGQNMYIVKAWCFLFLVFLKGLQCSPFIGLVKREICLLCFSVVLLIFTSFCIAFYAYTRFRRMFQTHLASVFQTHWPHLSNHSIITVK